MDQIKIVAEIDLEELTKSIKASESLEGNALFAKLSEVYKVKRQLDEAKDAFDKIEREVKQTINDRAKALYGKDWNTIKGDNYKINRTPTGDKYDIIGKASDDFVKVKLSPNSSEIDKFVKTKSKLPEGIAINHNRGESIRIKVDAGQE